METDVNYSNEPKFKYFVIAIEKSLKNFEYSSEWADLISCLGKLNKTIQAYPNFPVIPRKLLVGKRLAQCLHPALPSGVHLKALDTFGLVFNQIGAAGLAEDLFIYGAGLFPLFGHAAMSVKPVLLSIYETFFLPLGKKLIPCLQGFILGLLPGIEEVSEHTERTTELLENLCYVSDPTSFFSALWSCALFSSSARLPSMMFALDFLNKKTKQIDNISFMGNDCNLLVNATCAGLDDQNVLAQRTALDFILAVFPLHSPELGKEQMVFIMQYAISVVLRRDMSLNRRFYQWVLYVNNEGAPKSMSAGLCAQESTEKESVNPEEYFEKYSKYIVVMAMTNLFREATSSKASKSLQVDTNTRAKFDTLKPFRILISLLDKPEVGSVILEDVLVELFRCLYAKCSQIVRHSNRATLAGKECDELIKTANLLFNAFEPSFIWNYLERLLFSDCNATRGRSVDGENNDGKSLQCKPICILWDDSKENNVSKPSCLEVFQIIGFLLDIVALEATVEVQSDHWPLLLNGIIEFISLQIDHLSASEVKTGVSLLSNLLSKLSPAVRPAFSRSMSKNYELQQTGDVASLHSPPNSPGEASVTFSGANEMWSETGLEYEGENSNIARNISPLMQSIHGSKLLFVDFVEQRLFAVMNKAYASESQPMIGMNLWTKGTGLTDVMESLSEHKWSPGASITEESNDSKQLVLDDYAVCGEAFGLFCKFLLELSCFPIGNHVESTQAVSEQGNVSSYRLPGWLQSLLLCCCQSFDFDIKTCSIRTLLDLLNVSLSVFSHSSKMVQVETQSNIVPLVSMESLRQIEESPIYEMLAQNLWDNIQIDNCHQHKTCVELFLQLHNLTPSSSLCENVISLSLSHQDMDVRKSAHWRFSVLWHLSREFYKNDSNRCHKVLRTLDSCMLLCLDSLESPTPNIRLLSKNWFVHSNHHGDVGRLIEPLLLILLKPSSSRVSVHYVANWLDNSMSQSEMTSERKPTSASLSHGEIGMSFEEDGEPVTNQDMSGNNRKTGSSNDDLTDNLDVGYRGMKHATEADVSDAESDDQGDDQDIDNLDVAPVPLNASSQDAKNRPASLPNKMMRNHSTHPLLVHKLYYTQPYDSEQVLYALKTLRSMLAVNGRAFLCSATTASMSMCNTPHQHALRELLIRHRRALTGKEFYGSLIDSQHLLVRASTAKYIEVLLSVCLHYIRSEYHGILRLNQEDIDGNFAVTTATIDLLTTIVWEVLDLANDNGAGFASFVADLFRRCKVQRIALHCLLSTVYSVNGSDGSTDDWQRMTVNAAMDSRSDKMRFDLQRTLLSFVRSLIALEHCVGLADLESDHGDSQAKIKSRGKRHTKQSSHDKASPWEYRIHERLASQPMLLSVVLSSLQEDDWMSLHHDWNNLVIASLASLGTALPKVAVRVVDQLSLNLRSVAQLYSQVDKKQSSDRSADIPVDHVLTILEDTTAIAHYCLVDSSHSAAIMTPKPRRKGKRPSADDSSSSSNSLQIFSNLVHVFSVQGAQLKQQTTEEVDKPMADARENLLSIFPSVLLSLVKVWTVWNRENATDSTVLKSSLLIPTLEIGATKDVNQSVLQMLTPIAMNHTLVFLASAADVWCQTKSKEPQTQSSKPTNMISTKEWLASMNRKTIPDMTEEQQSLLNIITSIKALTLESLVDTSRHVLKHSLTSGTEKSSVTRQILEVNLLQLMFELVQRSDLEKVIQVRMTLLSLFRDGLTLNLSPPAHFVLMTIMSLFVQRVPVPEERRARKELQDLAQKLTDFCNAVAAASLESSAWFRRNLTVVNRNDESSNQEADNPWQVDDVIETTSSSTDGPPLSPTVVAPLKNSQFSVQALCTLAEVLAPMLDLLYTSEEKDRIASLLIYVMYNVIPYLKNHSTQNVNGFRAASAMLAAVTDYQYTLRAWKKDVYDLFLDNEFFAMDESCLEPWRLTIDRLMTYDPTLFKDLMTRVSVSQSGTINLFTNREQELEQRAQLLRRLSFVVFCGEVDQYHSHLPDIQERLAECVRQMQAPCLHEQVFLCFRVLMMRMSANHLISLWPPMITELVHVLLHLEQDLKVNGNSTAKPKPLSVLEGFVGLSTYQYKRTRWLGLYLAALKLLDLAISLPSELMPHFEIYRWSFFSIPGVDLSTVAQVEVATNVRQNHPAPTTAQGQSKTVTKKTHSDRKAVNGAASKSKGDISKMAVINGPKSKPSKSPRGGTKQETMTNGAVDQQLQKDVMRSGFLPYLFRVTKLLDGLRDPKSNQPTKPLLPHKVTHVNDLYPYLSGVTGLGASQLATIQRVRGFDIGQIELEIAREFLDT